jgi:hypothetical protein
MMIVTHPDWTIATGHKEVWGTPIFAMSPTNVNGRALGVQSNGIFSEANTDPIPGGRLWPEAAASWSDMRQYIGEKHGVWIAPAGSRSSARPISDQRYFYAHRPPAAAFPGTSNHGWAIAVDVMTSLMAYYIRKYGHKFGWSHDEGARVGEWWHYRYIGGYKSSYSKLTDSEERWVREYRELKAKGIKKDRRDVLRRAIKEQRKDVWRAAQKDGWRHNNRRYRYTTLRRFS